MIYNHGLNEQCQVDGFKLGDLSLWDSVNVWNFYGPTLHDIVGISRSGLDDGTLVIDGSHGSLLQAPRLQSLGARGGAVILDTGDDTLVAAKASTPVYEVPAAPQVVGEGKRCGFSFQE